MMNIDNKWTVLARKWMYYLPPGRPSSLDLDNIESLIRQHIPRKGAKALILGSTPEYRDLLHRLGFLVSVADRNSDMVNAMKELRVYDSDEDIYVDDWFLFLPKHKREFDVILGDFIQGNVSYEKQGELYELISKALAPNGVFIERVLTFRDDSPIYLSDQLITEYAKSPINLTTLNDMMFRLFFTSDLVYKWKMVDVNKVYEFLREKSKHYPGLDRFIPFLREYIFGDGLVWYYGSDWSTVKEYYFKSLQLVEEVPDMDTVYSKFAYIIVTCSK